MENNSAITARVEEFKFRKGKLQMTLTLPVEAEFAGIREVSVEKAGYSIRLEDRTPTLFLIVPTGPVDKTNEVEFFLVPRDEEFVIYKDSIGRRTSEYLGTVEMTYRGQLFHLFATTKNLEEKN